MEEDYCPIKTLDGKCGAGGECDHRKCWEKMHYYKVPDGLGQKMRKWEDIKRGDKERWKNKDSQLGIS